MGFLTDERVADGAEERLFGQPGYQWCSLCLLCVLLFIELDCSFGDLSVRDLVLVERVRRMVLRKRTGQLTEESKQRSVLEKAAPVTKALRKFLTDFDRIIRGRSTAAERDGSDVRRTRYDRYLSCSSTSVSGVFESEQGSVEEFYLSDDGLTGWDSLPDYIHENILQRLGFQDLFRFKVVSKDWRKFIEGDAFRKSQEAKTEGSFTGIHYYIKNRSWHSSGYDLLSNSWKALPAISCRPELFEEFSVCGHGALMCADVSKNRKGELVVCNPLTKKKKALPPLLYPRNPVLLHIWVDFARKSYKVIVAGSRDSSQDRRKPDCKIMEVFDSSTSKWKETCNIPGPLFGLSRHQTGVIVNGTLFFISYLDGHRPPRGDYVLAWDMENWRYLENWECPIPSVLDSKSFLQLVENDGKVYLFSESKEDVQGQGVQGPGIVCHRIDEMKFQDLNAGAIFCQWRNVVEVRKTGVQEVCEFPQFRRDVVCVMCVGFGIGKLCIFNTRDWNGVVYNMLDGCKCEVLGPPPEHQTGDKPPAHQKGDKVFNLYPASFTFHPSFASDP